MSFLYFHMLLINPHHGANWTRTCKLQTTGRLSGKCKLFQTSKNKRNKCVFRQQVCFPNKENNVSSLPVTINNTKVATINNTKVLTINNTKVVTINNTKVVTINNTKVLTINNAKVVTCSSQKHLRFITDLSDPIWTTEILWQTS